jgi:uncharacterized delta-60 repeat protein
MKVNKGATLPDHDFNRQKSNSISKRGVRYARQMAAMLIVVVFVSSSLMMRVEAAAGDLDPSFGTGGRVTTAFGPGSFIEYGYDVAVQADGKIIAVGYAGGDFGLARYKPDGSRDTTFGNGGKAMINLGTLDTGDTAYTVAIQSDGKILVGGDSIGDGALVRCNIDGSLDTTFGNGGKVLIPVNGNNSIYIYALAVQPDGRILAAGSANFTLASGDFALYRFNANGSLDPSFGASGAVYTDFYGGNDIAVAAAIQPDGRIIVVGQARSNSSNDIDFAIARYNADGSLDPMFGTDGLVTTAFLDSNFPYASNVSYAGSVALLSGGRILVGGATTPAFALARYNSDGGLDTTFGTGGKTALYVSEMAVNPRLCHKMIVQDDGKIVMSANRGFSSKDFLGARFNSDGSLDTSFGSAGTVVTDFFGYNDVPATIAPYGNDQLIIAGWVKTNSSNSDFGLARYLGDAMPTSADLSTTMSAAFSTDFFGNRYLTYAINIADSGPNNAYYVTLRNRLPLNTVFHSLTVPTGWVVYSKPPVGQYGTVSLSKTLFGKPTPQATITLVVKVHPSVSHTTLANSATFTSNFTPDPNLANNTASAQTNIP